ncbi:DUF3575 domain-containing protein [Bacteroides fluxus]|uniref:DUF3575 domain-containing protein n=1 Tax=Bacteroides fluxus YIT 12057 TaxID=763034 RepID=F3PWA7_9BACE|nr:DUF3575 domain-containing protein [Bacteroides fluxus]EGF52456.1 hypothetical protein HMPREF9446_03042 [Bacteroides fluxus YIT 12057]MDY3788075.1 DUF3575 domain-containing protein [Bacteroides fluxus]
MFLYRRWLTVIAGLLFFFFNTVSAQKAALKSNLLYDATGSINLGLELAVAGQWTMDVSGSYNAWDFPNDKKWRHILVQPEARYWLCDRFNGHFFGIHAQWMKFNIGNVDMPFGLWEGARSNRFQGDLWGGGLAYGYSWLLSRHWNLEAEVGVGYNRVIYDRYPCASCGSRIASDARNYFGPTKLALSFVYLF